MRHSSTQLLVIVSILALAGVVACVFVYTRIQGHQVAVAEILQELEAELVREEQLKTIEGLMRDIQTERTTLDRQFLKEEDVVSFITLLESLDSYTGARIVIDSVSQQENTLRIVLDATGSWTSVYHTFVMLEALPQASTMTNMLFAGSADAVWRARVTTETLLAPDTTAL